MLPALHYRSRPISSPLAIIFDLSLFLGATVSVLSFYVYAQRQIDKKWWQKLGHMPLLMSIGIGMCLNQSRAVLEALRGHESPFVRTPKYMVASGDKGRHEWKSKRYAVKKNMVPMLELFFAAYFVVVIGYAVWRELWLAVPFLGLFLWGFGYIGLKSVLQQRSQQRVGEARALAMHVEG